MFIPCSYHGSSHGFISIGFISIGVYIPYLGRRKSTPNPLQNLILKGEGGSALIFWYLIFLIFFLLFLDLPSLLDIDFCLPPIMISLFFNFCFSGLCPFFVACNRSIFCEFSISWFSSFLFFLSRRKFARRTIRFVRLCCASFSDSRRLGRDTSSILIECNIGMRECNASLYDAMLC